MLNTFRSFLLAALTITVVIAVSEQPSTAKASACYYANRTAGSAPVVTNDALRLALYCYTQTKNAYTWSCTSRRCEAVGQPGLFYTVSEPWGAGMAVVFNSAGVGQFSGGYSDPSHFSWAQYNGVAGNCDVYMTPSPVPPYSYSVPAVQACF